MYRQQIHAPNGLNLNKSIGNPTSRFEKIREYLRVNGPSTKKDILYYVFGLGAKYGYFRKEQKNGTTYWSAA